MNRIQQALARLAETDPQVQEEVVRGVRMRLTQNGIPVIRIHYSADPTRDPDLNPQWKKEARKGYSSQASWDREQEVIHEAGGGELVFAETLRTYWNKIVITDPLWRPAPSWKVLGGFDHGKTNPTSLNRAYIDNDANIYFCGEYYVPGKNVWQHAPEILKMPDINRFEDCFADPSIFDQKTQQQDQTEAKAISQLYEEKGINFLTSFGGNRNDLTFAERVLAHWSNLDEFSPSLYIVCRNFSERPQPGLHPWDSPNLLWELLRTRKKKLTAQQLMTQNPAEQILDKDNHARDCMKYVVMSLPEPAKKTVHQRLEERLSVIPKEDITSRSVFANRIQAELEKEDEPITLMRTARTEQFMQRRRRNL